MPIQALLPDLLHGAIRSQAYHKIDGLGTQTEKLIIKRILQNEPGFPPEKLLAHPDRGTQAYLEPGNTVP